MPITKEREIVFNQIKEMKFDDTNLLKNLCSMSSRIVNEYPKPLAYNDSYFKSIYDEQCPMCKTSYNIGSIPLRYTIIINELDSILPKGAGQEFVFIASYTIICSNLECKWHIENLIYYGYCAGFLKDIKPSRPYNTFPDRHYKQFYLESKTLDQIREEINSKSQK